MAAVPEDAIDFSKTLLGKDPIGPLSKLLWECQKLHSVGRVDSPLIPMFMAQNAAATAWHMTDWTWMLCPLDKREELARAVGAARAQSNEYALAVRQMSQDVAICRDLATASKHVTISRGEMKNLTVEVEHDEEHGLVQIWICVDEDRMPAIDVFARALRWWIDLYIHIGFEQAEQLREALETVERR